MKIKLECCWSLLGEHYKSSLVGSEIIADDLFANLSPNPLEWRAGLLFVLPARIYRDGKYIGEVDVLGEVTSVIIMAIPALADEFKVSIKILKPYTG